MVTINQFRFTVGRSKVSITDHESTPCTLCETSESWQQDNREMLTSCGDSAILEYVRTDIQVYFVVFTRRQQMVTRS